MKGGLRLVVCLLGISCSLAGAAQAAADVPVNWRHELPLEALWGTQEDFTRWRDVFSATFRDKMAAIPSFVPISSRRETMPTVEDIQIFKLMFEHPSASPLYGKDSGGLLLVPPRTDSSKPVVIALHGHEVPFRGEFADALVSERGWPFELAQAGYIVWLPVGMHHDDITKVAAIHSYIMTWAKIASDGLDYAITKEPSLSAGAGYAVVGLSAGGQTAYALMAYREDILAGVFAGAEQPLDFMRREYRIKGHPNCWDIEWLSTYTPIQILIAPRQIQFQMGKKDPWFPSGEPFARQGNFSGTFRDVLADEIGGHMLTLQSVWRKLGGDISYDIHEEGHEVDVKAALLFLGQVKEKGAFKWKKR